MSEESKFTLLDPEHHKEIITLVNDVAESLDCTVPALYQIVGERPLGMGGPAALYNEDSLLIAVDFFGKFSTKEQKAITAHELQHTKHSVRKLVWNDRVGLFAYNLSRFLEEHPLPGASYANRFLGNLVEHCIAYVAEQEYEADAAGASVTDPKTMRDALLKAAWITLHEHEFSDLSNCNDPVEKIVAHLDSMASAGDVQEKLLCGCTLGERIGRLDQISLTLKGDISILLP